MTRGTVVKVVPIKAGWSILTCGSATDEIVACGGGKEMEDPPVVVGEAGDAGEGAPALLSESEDSPSDSSLESSESTSIGAGTCLLKLRLRRVGSLLWNRKYAIAGPSSAVGRLGILFDQPAEPVVDY